MGKTYLGRMVGMGCKININVITVLPIFLKAIIVIPLFVPFLIFGTNLESWPILLALSMMSFVLSMYVSAYGLRLYVE